MPHLRLALILLFIILNTISVLAQEKPFNVVNISPDGSKYIKFGMNLQVWGRYSELNPNSKIGTTEVNDAYDIVIRRLRLQAMGMITENIFFHLQLGQNNINFTQNNGPSNAPLSVMDALGEYHFNEKLHIGGGLTAWGAGTTRYSANSSSSQLTLDTPMYQQFANTSSTFGNRNLSIYAKGYLGKFNYRAAITNPYRNSNNNLGLNSTLSTETPRAQYSGILTYSFLDKESLEDAYHKGTYLGTKKVFNVALGYMTQAKAMWHLTPDATVAYDDMKVLGFDVFYDSPINAKGAALTAYAAFNNNDYGKNYIQSVNTPNPAIGDNTLINGSGAGFIGVGTGNIYYAQLGYLFGKSDNEAKKGRFQPYAATQIADLEALDTPMTMYELGVNYYTTGTLGPKFSLNYQNRAVYDKTLIGAYKQSDRLGMVVLQCQVSF
ncbi:OprO/OprP family phosphate-selective porin [Flavobacterium piscisymbiosum]|uniref:OprO/OprP family phosphate-selective porin n=1 Tax=Flavobacterium piscisymbiosum TaxID=2893753 RepID=A0ABS8MI77_9FLAO|nr:OprO/OprP family phosphate-selective porin [Flavobacterium sp. F-30]MCC9065204.1 OprO/OprP family phosphate-selective porin [Flavobacterium sp. F-30]